MSTYIRTLKQGDNVVLPRTQAGAVTLEDGTSVEAKIGTINTTLSNHTSTLASQQTTIDSHTSTLASHTTSINAKVNTADIINNLTSETTTAPLSAKMGKTLNTSISSLSSTVATLVTDAGYKVEVTFDTTTYNLTPKLYNKAGALISTGTSVNIPIESAIISGSYDSVNKKLIFTLKSGATIEVPLTDLVSGLVNVSDIQDVLTSTETQKPLSANQGRVLKGYVDTINSNRVSAFQTTPDDTHYPSEKLVYDQLATKANIDGSYESLNAGTADQLNSPDGSENTPDNDSDNNPFIFRSTAGSTSVSDGNAQIEKVRGRSLVFNQLGRELNSDYWNSNYGTTTFSDGIASLTLTSLSGYQGIKNVYNTISLVRNHKYLFSAGIYAPYAGNALFFFYNDAATDEITVSNALTANKWCYVSAILTNTTSGNHSACFGVPTTSSYSVGNVIKYKNCMLIDLTLLYGKNKEPSTVAEFKKDFPNSYYAYNTGEIINVKPTAMKTVGFNIVDFKNATELTPSGTQGVGGKITNLAEGKYIKGYHIENAWNSNDVTNYSVSGTKISFTSASQWYGVGYVTKVTQTANGYIGYYSSATNARLDMAFYDKDGNYLSLKTIIYQTATVPPTGSYWAVVIVNAPSVGSAEINDPCVHVKWSYDDAKYEDYWSQTRAVPATTAKDTSGNTIFAEGLNGVGSVYDELTSSTAVKRFGVYTFTGNETWGRGLQAYWTNVLTNPKIPASDSVATDAICSTLEAKAVNVMNTDSSSVGFGIARAGTLYIGAVTYANRASLVGKKIVYELATPVEYALQDPWNPLYKESDFGTEEWIYDSTNTPVRVPTEITYQSNLVDKLRGISDLSTSELSEILTILS